VRRVRHLAVQGDDVASDVREGGERLAVRFADRDFVAQLVGGQRAALGRDYVRLGLGRSRDVDAQVALATQFGDRPSGSSSVLPCRPSWSSTAFTPRPFIVLAMIATGRSVVFSASV
jgi:hypothetical protein